MELESPHPFQAREERYDELCRSLNLDEETRKIGWSLLRRLTLKAGQQDEVRTLLYTARSSTSSSPLHLARVIASQCRWIAFLAIIHRGRCTYHGVMSLACVCRHQERFVLCMAACALYVAGMPEQRTPASTTSGGSCVSLTQLLRATHIR